MKLAVTLWAIWTSKRKTIWNLFLNYVKRMNCNKGRMISRLKHKKGRKRTNEFTNCVHTLTRNCVPLVSTAVRETHRERSLVGSAVYKTC